MNQKNGVCVEFPIFDLGFMATAKNDWRTTL
jgi:hypothetical protein